ncbi:MAG: hypothetical protein AB1486_12830 [Planctomycetota bacterium]
MRTMQLAGLHPPFLSTYDPPVAAEGSVDPLSLQPTYEHLAERILPFLTVRMRRPRFLTAMAVGAHVCWHEPLRDQLASDGRSPAWIVYEWHVIEAAVRCSNQQEGDHGPGVAGFRKVSDAIKAGRRVSAASYLKTPQVFGIHGIYRRLARGLNLVQENGDSLELDEGGHVLLRTWEKEQGLPGFYTGDRGPGADLRLALLKAIREAMTKGYACQPPTWPYWAILDQHLRPDRAGKAESRVILERLLGSDARPHPTDPEALLARREFFEHLADYGEIVLRQEEKSFFHKLMKKASPSLRERLDRIDAYEGLCRLLHDGFQLILYLATRKGATPLTSEEYASHDLARHLVRRIGPAVERIENKIAQLVHEEELTRLLDRYRHVRQAGDLYATLLDHHEQAQREKPPDGKRAWVERLEEGVVVRPIYRLAEPPEKSDAYVHDYRTNSASLFLRDLGRIRR